MLYIAKSILHDTYLAEEAVSEAFIRIINNLQKIHTVNCYQTKGFVVIIVRNIAFDILRKQNRNKTVPIDDYTEYIGLDDNEPILDNLISKEACTKITSAILRINKSYSDILYLKIIFGYSDEEISKILGITRNNIKMRLCRARKALKEELLKEDMQ